MDEMIIEFSSDLKELLSEIEDALMRVDDLIGSGNITGPEDLNEMFRNLHTIKGTCSFFEMNVTRNLSHKMEDLLDLFRQGLGTMDATHVQLLFDGVDCLKKIAENIQENEPETIFEAEANTIKKKILSCIEKIESPQNSDIVESELPQKVLPLPDPKIHLSEDSSIKVSKTNANKINKMFKKFALEAREKLDISEQVFIDLEHGDVSNQQEMIDKARRNLHTLKGNAGFMGYKGIEDLTHAVETALEQKIDQIDTIADFQIYYDAIDELRRACFIISEGQTYSANPSMINRLYGNSLNEIETVPQIATNKDTTDSSTPKKTEESAKTIAPKNKAPQDAFVRVPVNKLDLLMDLLGEVILVASMVTHHPDLQDLELEGFENTSHQLDLLLRQLQDAAMSLRLIPISNVFQRMKRLIRDFIQETHKKIDFVISGEETEVDKSVAEMLNDPLVHLLRNAADHGLESIEDRLSADKPETGTIRLSASQAGGELRIVVEDDGRGLNRDKILAKARERGLCDNDEEPDDRTVWSYIFHPGFSTAEQITNISGRGVGMDVVMSNVKNMRGKVTVDSNPGKGSCITLHIPLTLAILDGMVIKINQILYVLPIETVVEILQPQKKQINHSAVDRQFVIRIRDDLVPVVFLNQLYDQDNNSEKQLENQVMMVIETDGVQLAMPVDELLGQQQVVIKPLVGHLKNIRAVSGCALLGSGNVAMVLDVGQLHQLHEQNVRMN
ncbi:chemotaxis protein CheA [Candidatus Magnetomorum sp. HK-1]|nr:chemotaxis protein CheA [Candidatus Magnetomorum sp. HK-1]